MVIAELAYKVSLKDFQVCEEPVWALAKHGYIEFAFYMYLGLYRSKLLRTLPKFLMRRCRIQCGRFNIKVSMKRRIFFSWFYERRILFAYNVLNLFKVEGLYALDDIIVIEKFNFVT